MTSIRGSAAVETALTISFTLLVLYATVQLATTAFYQISADGATFVAAHDTVQSVGAPTSANRQAAAASGTEAFKRIVAGSISALNPSSSTFESDVSQQVPGITAVGSGTPLTISSRLIEASAGTASSSPLSNCAQGALNLSNGGTSLLSNLPVGLLQGGTLVSLGALNGSPTSTLNLNTTALTTRLSALNAVSTSLTSTVTSLNTTASALKAVTLLAPLITPLLNSLSSDLQAPVASAFSGTLSTSSAVTTLNAQLASQVPLLGSLLALVVDPILTAPATGLLSSSGPLASLNSAMSNLKTIDTGAVTCP
jgi:hypothetical protein